MTLEGYLIKIREYNSGERIKKGQLDEIIFYGDVETGYSEKIKGCRFIEEKSYFLLSTESEIKEKIKELIDIKTYPLGCVYIVDYKKIKQIKENTFQISDIVGKT